MSQIFIVGIAGGSCSGKTTLSRELFQHLGGEEKCALIYQDSYYIDQSHRFREDGGDVNFDHPSALEFSLLAAHLRQLKSKQPVRVPIYDFATHTRKQEYVHVDPKPIIIVDGTLILSQPEVVSELHSSVFLEVPEETRFERRKRRDTLERGRTLDGVVKQFLNHVKPMHDQFVEPSKNEARIVARNDDLVSELVRRIFDGV